MKVTVTMQVELDIKYVRISAAVRYDEEDMPNDFPFRKGDTWDITVDIKTGKIEHWPENVEHDLHMKVVDQGSYWLLDEDRQIVGWIHEDYVPNGVVPGEYGDYIVMQIKGDGTIANWPKRPDVSGFFPRD